MATTVGELAALVGGRVVGDPATLILSAQPIVDARSGDITFAEDERNAQRLCSSQASAAIVPDTVPPNGIPLIVVDDPFEAFSSVVAFLRGKRERRPPGIDPHCSVHPSAQLGADPTVYPGVTIDADVTIGDRCVLYPGVYIGSGCRLGNDVVLHPNVVLYAGTVLGRRVIVHAGSVIGSDGFGYRLREGRHVKMPQAGHVEIGDDVEIGACATIDRGTFGATTLGEGTKIDNLVQIAHNCRIGRHNLFVGQVGVAGSVTTGDYVVAAGQVGIRDHVTIGEGVVIGAKAGVSKDVQPGLRIVGAPARPESELKRILMSFNKLPDMRRKLRQLEREVAELRKQIDEG